MKEVKRYYSTTQMREINPHFKSECGATGYVDGADFDAVLKERDALQKRVNGLSDYVRHYEYCNKPDYPGECTCGLGKYLEEGK